MFHEDKALLIGTDGGDTGYRAAIEVPVSGAPAKPEDTRANEANDSGYVVEGITSPVDAVAKVARISADVSLCSIDASKSDCEARIHEYR